MATRFSFLLISIFLFTVTAFSLQPERIVEDFTSYDFADLQNSSGIWNAASHQIRAGVVANGVATRPIEFGDGSDGILNTRDGYTFDTNTKPNGYNFVSLAITGGTVSVVGKNPLIIRSLGSAIITPTFSVDGKAGVNGSSAVSTASTLGPNDGGETIGSYARGGFGGMASSGAGSGGDGLQFNGLADSGGTGGVGNGGGGTNHGNGSIGGPGDFDLGGFAAGSGGGGGGAHFGGGTKSSGGSGGGGGGTVRITALDKIIVGTITAKGGDGGSGKDEDGVGCSGNESGHGAGGNGGAVWIQSLLLANAENPDVNGGNGGTGLGCGAGAAGVAGVARLDAPSATGALAATYSTTNAAPNKDYTVLSKPYDLKTSNAAFTFSWADTRIPVGGSIRVSYAGSSDGTEFSEFSSDITTLSNRGFRYVKFRVDIRTATTAAASPTVSKVIMDFYDLGTDNPSVALTGLAGCGTLKSTGSSTGKYSSSAGWLLFWLLLYGAVRTVNLLVVRRLPTWSLPTIRKE